MTNNVPDEIKIPDGWDVVSVRAPKEGEYFVWNGHAVKCDTEVPNGWRLIIRPKFVWPPWLTAPWIAMDECGLWWGYECEPSMAVKSWGSNRRKCILDPHLLDIAFPDLPWRESKMRNPHRKDCSAEPRRTDAKERRTR